MKNFVLFMSMIVMLNWIFYDNNNVVKSESKKIERDISSVKKVSSEERRELNKLYIEWLVENK